MFRTFLIASVAVLVSVGVPVDAAQKSELTMVVMDPLAGPLACDCVQGYAQRKYEHLGTYLQKELSRPVKVVWSESLPAAIKEHGEAHLVIGKHSVVKFDARKANTRFRPVASLTGVDGSTTQSGLIVVRKEDSAKTVDDLSDYRIFFGPKDCDEKHAAPIAMLTAAGVALPTPMETSPACSTAAASLMELPADTKAAAVISSYAEPLLEGCGTIRKGDLRVIGESEPVPFISAFVNTKLSKSDIDEIRTALIDVELDAELLVALESGAGFQKWKPVSKHKSANASTAPPASTSKKK